MIRGEESALYSEGDHRRRCCNGPEHQVHHRRLDEYGIQRAHTGQDEAGHGAWEHHQADRFGGFDLGNECRAQRSSHVRLRGDVRGCPRASRASTSSRLSRSSSTSRRPTSTVAARSSRS